MVKYEETTEVIDLPPAGSKKESSSVSLVRDLLPDPFAETAFDTLKSEVDWQTMNHRGNEVPRLVAVQGKIEGDGSIPIYRHPADSSPPLSPFSPTVAKIKDIVEEAVSHPVNHVLIQLYRNGQDAISEHSDKTIDVVHGSKIVNVSLGAQRTMVLRPKKLLVENASTKAAPSPGDDEAPPPGAPYSRPSVRIPLPHNSMFVLDLHANRLWLHGINRDKRPEHIKSHAELFTHGERISLTFRYIGTFLSADETLIWGQGATAKDKGNAHPVTPRGPAYREDRLNLIRAFSKENQDSDFVWEEGYEVGSDVLHLEGVE